LVQVFSTLAVGAVAVLRHIAVVTAAAAQVQLLAAVLVLQGQ
jgi:hypothetical protein